MEARMQDRYKYDNAKNVKLILATYYVYSIIQYLYLLYIINLIYLMMLCVY